MRPVTQGDVIRADAKEIPRIFQLLYAGEGEARRPDDPNQQELNTLKNVSDERIGITTFKGKRVDRNSSTSMIVLQHLNTIFRSTGHEFVPITYHMPTACEVCPRPLWHVFKPPAAYECKR